MEDLSGLLNVVDTPGVHLAPPPSILAPILNDESVRHWTNVCLVVVVSRSNRVQNVLLSSRSIPSTSNLFAQRIIGPFLLSLPVLLLRLLYPKLDRSWERRKQERPTIYPRHSNQPLCEGVLEDCRVIRLFVPFEIVIKAVLFDQDSRMIAANSVVTIVCGVPEE
ncbi:hypothetical protein FB446DRAFT_64010 [Lentinula raphanica]|nr:hypothetical protein FB446DRAFT_64010 [Lentinula raphanica]